MEPVTFSQVDWKKDESVGAFVEQALKLREQCNEDMERQAEINIAFVRGHQLVSYNRYTRQTVIPANPKNRARLVVNLERGFVDGFVAKLGLDKIRMYARPATTDVADYDTAELQSKVLDYYGRRLNVAQISELLDSSAVITGEGFLKVVWDPQAGKEFDINPEDVGLSPAEFERQFGKSILSLRPGDVSFNEVSVFNIFWTPDAEFETADWVLEVYDRSVAYVQERYGLSGDDARGKAVSDKATRVWRPGQGNSWGTVVQGSDGDTVRVVVLWVRPNQAIAGLRRGRHCIYIGDEVIENTPNPYDHQQVPIVRFPLLLTPGQTRGETFVSDLHAPQRNINKTCSQFAENRELMANPRWLARQNSIVNEDQWNSNPGGIGYYSGDRPSIEPGASMPSAVLAMMENDKRHMQDISALHDVSQGKNPPGVRSGKAIALLKEPDDERFGRVALRRQATWSTVGQLLLQTLHQYVTEERLIRIVGDESEIETVTFTGSMLAGSSPGLGVDYYDVEVLSSGPPESRSARLEKLDRAMERGFLRPDQDDERAYVLDMLDLGVSRRRMDSAGKARRLQHVRNRQMVQGQYTPPAMYEDLNAMMVEMNDFRHELFFAELPEETKEMFDRYEREAISIMALREPRLKKIVQQAMQKAGVSPEELPAPTGAPPTAPAQGAPKPPAGNLPQPA